MQNKRLLAILTVAAILLLIPFLAMRFTDEVNWNRTDFVVAGVLLFGTGLLIEVALRIVKKTSYRLAVVGAILFTLFMVWAELAVGLIGTRFAGS